MWRHDDMHSFGCLRRAGRSGVAPGAGRY